LITTIHQKKYGISDYGSQSVKAEEIKIILGPDNIHRSAIKAGNFTIANVYKPQKPIGQTHRYLSTPIWQS